MTLVSDRRQDTTKFLAEHGEVLTLKRRSVTYDDEGKATTSWVTVTTFSGDWQPRSGNTYRDEEGLEIRSNAQIITEYDLDVKADDRVYKADGTYEKVNHPLKFDDHITIRLTGTERA